jgi:hypothetical protein
MTKLTQSTIEHLKYYVYILTDPRKKSQPFYVGKGKGNRINTHLMDARKDRSESKKLKRIQDIEDAGKKVGLEVVRFGLNERTAYEVESALIDLIGLSSLTNEVKGHKTSIRGRSTIEELQIKYEAKVAELDNETLLININRLYKRHMSLNDVYDVTRRDWKIGSDRTSRGKTICAEAFGIIRGVFVNPVWSVSRSDSKRKEFVADQARPAMLRKYLNHSVPPRKLGSQNPIRGSWSLPKKRNK